MFNFVFRERPQLKTQEKFEIFSLPDPTTRDHCCYSDVYKVLYHMLGALDEGKPDILFTGLLNVSGRPEA